jgi:hypothetical protein
LSLIGPVPAVEGGVVSSRLGCSRWERLVAPDDTGTLIGRLPLGTAAVEGWHMALDGSNLTEAALRRPGTRPFDFSGRPMKGWVTVAADALEADEALAVWVEVALGFVRTLPPK